MKAGVNADRWREGYTKVVCRRRRKGIGRVRRKESAVEGRQKERWRVMGRGIRQGRNW